ncbi:SDR family oxidoreductase [Aeromicrobium fastidiosum]|uniref:SDR family oxidoreductase n=1 Tax=Aeromicrobium fastidiosum TaxID=52699 RepID=A0A641ALM8_9ACTN|nr:SDR family oxidoreductase [Aeromicrobium fastidiosum]KAA1374794.1 SDR family oxidoreductase [Aeromicrobium fastidiosum]MBP2390655.1 NADP-dependent 3-hydroxy acid dehydrogenase YdfG [Aeromicrobium fastidiosum]
MTAPVVLVVAAGPGVSGSVARLLAADGYRVGLLGSDAEAVDELAASISDDPDVVRRAVVDATDVAGLTGELTQMARAFGRVDVLHFNPSAYRGKNPLEVTVDELLADVAVGVGALLTSVQAVRPFMSAGGRITVTGSVAADRPSPDAATLGVQKAGVRNLVTSLDAHLRGDGIRAVSVTVRGALAREGAFTPDRVAAAIVAAARQDEAGWRTEVPYDG